MMYTLSLALHLIGGVSLFTLFIASFIAAVKSIHTSYKKLMLAIGGNALFQVVSGAALFLSAGNTMSGGQFCARLSIYVALTVVFEGILLYKLTNSVHTDVLLDKRA
jgi:hypothetical protein